MDKKRANEFLKYWKQILLENPYISFKDLKDKRIIYHELIKLGLKKEEECQDIDRLNFGRWINYYAGKEINETILKYFWCWGMLWFGFLIPN